MWRICPRDLITDIEPRSFHSQITCAQSRSVRHDPDIISFWRGANGRVLIEQDQIVRRQCGRQHEVRREPSRKRFDKALEQPPGHGHITAESRENCFDPGPDSVANNGNGPYMNRPFPGNMPQKV